MHCWSKTVFSVVQARLEIVNNAVKVAAYVHAAKAAWSADVAQSWSVTKTSRSLVHQFVYYLSGAVVRTAKATGAALLGRSF